MNDVDKTSTDLGKSNQIPHEHVYELAGGPHVFYAECECGEKFNRGNGVVCGSRQRVEAAVGRKLRVVSEQTINDDAAEDIEAL